MPHVAKAIPRPCPCGKHMIRQPYKHLCTWCYRALRKRRKADRKLARDIKRMMRDG